MCALVRNDMFIYDIAKEITMKYGFIGCGNMGGAIARALSKSTTDILVTDRSGKAGALAGELNIGYTDIADITKRKSKKIICYFGLLLQNWGN